METEICEISDSKEDSKLQDLPSKKKKTKRCISAEKIASTNEEVKDLKQSGKERHIIKRKSDQFEINQSSISEYDKKRKRKKHEPSELEPTAVQQSSDEVNVQKEKKKRKSDRSLEKDTANLKSGSLVTGEGDSEVSIKNTCQNLSGKKGSDLQDKYGQDLPEELINPCKDGKYRSNLPDTLIRFMYQLELSVLCSLRKLRYEHKYRSLSLEFKDFEIEKFNNIVLRYEEKSIYVHVENVDEYYLDNYIGYAGLFTKEKEKGSFFINIYFESFVKYQIPKLDLSSNSIEYLIIYTNSSLDLTEENAFKRGRSRNFYPFKFDSLNMEECEILKDFFFTNDAVPGRGFYQFSRDKTVREELLKRLEFSPAVLNAVKERNLSEDFKKEIKNAFVNKLVFAVNQPSREELNRIFNCEIEQNSQDQVEDYMILQEKILSDLLAPGKSKKLRNDVSRIIYEFNLLTLFLHDMFSHKNMLSINFEGNRRSNDITINYKDRVTYVKALNVDTEIGYSQLFPPREREGENFFSIRKHFTLFVRRLKNVRYFIIYTNSNLKLTEEKNLKKDTSRKFFPFKFDSIDIQKKRYKVLRDCSCINERGLYQFSKETITREKVVGQLRIPSFLQTTKEEGRLSDENEEEIKKKFLDRLIFAVNQHGAEELNNIVRKETDKKSNNFAYSRKELREITLRWLESHEFGHITKGIMEKLLEDIKNNRSSYHLIRNTDINEEINFAKSVVGRIGTPTFNQFLDFLIKGEGKRYLEVLKRETIDLSKVSSILNRAGNTSVKAFGRLYDLWFDKDGNKKQCLRTLEKEGMDVASMSGILNGAGNNAAEALKGLCDLWFDEEGNKTLYLKSLEEQGINLSSISSMLNGAGSNSAKSFRDLYNLWFNEEGTQTKYLTTLETYDIHLIHMTSILNGAGNNAVKAFKVLYDLWFDETGNRTEYLKTLEKEGINLVNLCSILSGAGVNAAKAFQDLYDLWFDAKGNKTHYLKTLEKEGINLSNVSSILSRSAANAAKTFRELYRMWFDADGHKTLYLKILEKERINLASVSSILHGAAAHAAKAFKELYDLWFDAEGNKTKYLKTLEKYDINLINMTSILNGAGNNAVKAFKVLYDLWFDAEGNKTMYLETLEKEGIDLTTMSSILGGAGANFAKAFKELYDIWFDKQGNTKQHLKDFIGRKDGGKSFRINSLSGMLSGAGAKAKDAFEKLHCICFTDKGKITELLNDFYNASFEPSNLSSILCGAGVRASSFLKKLHSVCFDEAGERTKLLDDFNKIGFMPGDLCRILSGAINSLEDFHEFCFVGETKQYLIHFINEEKGFSPCNLSEILHGARSNVCSALKDLHDVCFDETGNKTKVLGDFHQVGFEPNDLSKILCMAGNNASRMLVNFHKSCFNKDNYLSHLLAEKELFRPKNISNTLKRAGLNICPTFEKFHDLCFDKEGKKTKYLKRLIQNKPSYKILNILFEKVRKDRSTL